MSESTRNGMSSESEENDRLVAAMAADEAAELVGLDPSLVNDTSEPTPPRAGPAPLRTGRWSGEEEVGSTSTVRPIQFATFGESTSTGGRNNIELLLDVELQLTAELGQTRLTIKEILELSSGSIIELDRLAGEPIDISVNNTVIAKGEVVVVDEKFGIRVLNVFSPAKRLASVS